MFKFRRYFFLSGLVAFGVIAALLGIFVRQMVRTNLLEVAESKNVVLAQAFSNSLWPTFAPLVEDSKSLSPAELAQDERLPQLYQLVASQTADLSVVRVKIYNMDGLTVFSTEMSQIGEAKQDNAGFLAAQAGAVASELAHRDTFSAFEQTISDRDVFSSYIPIFPDKNSPDPVGVFEIYDDVTPLVVRSNQVQVVTMSGVLVLLGILFGFLAVIGQRIFNIAERQYENIKRSEQNLRESEAKYSNLFQQSGDGIFILDWNGRIHDINPRIVQMLGYSREELLTMTIEQLHPPDSQTRMQERSRRLLEEGFSQFEIDFITKSGTLLPAEVSVTMSDLRGERVLQGTVRDIRERKLQELALRQARDDALATSRLKTQLLANVSHDLRTPLNAILGYSEMLQAGVYGRISQEQQEATAQIIDSTGHLLNFVNNLLDQAHIEAGQLKLNERPFYLDNLVAEVQEQVKVLAKAKGLTLKSVIAPGTPTEIVGDRYWLRQVLTNLISNAIKFTEEGSVETRIYPLESGHWVLEVSDSGIGIPVESQERIFEPFWQVPGDKMNLGFGVGLSIVKELVTMMDGTVQLSSRQGSGSTFTVTLPLKPIAEFSP